MRIGLIARADSRGLGIQTKAFHDHMHPTKTMVVDCPSAKPLPLRRDWYPNATWINGLPTTTDFRHWLHDLDVVYTAETGYGSALWTEANRAGIRTVLHANWEFLDRRDQPTTWAAPSMWHINEFPTGSVLLPVPLETHRFPARADFPAARSATRFLHIVGRPAIHDRNGTADLLRALRHIQTPITLTVKCQEPGYVDTLVRRIPAHVTLTVDAGDTTNYWDNYRGHDVLVMPRRFGGLCLPANEALAAGMPVIMTDIDPNNTWLPADWLITAGKTTEFQAKNRIAVYGTDPQLLAAKIDQFAADSAFFNNARNTADKLADTLSWAALKPRYDTVLAG